MHSSLIIRAFLLAVLIGTPALWAQQPAHAASVVALKDATPVSAHYFGDSSAAQSLTARSAKPLSLATADFDEDGTPDLVSGYATGGGAGAVSIHRGNVNALWPYGAALRNGTPPAFLPDARVVALPEAPDFLGTGDFDADGHWDIVAAHRGSAALWFLRGDGKGGFHPAERIALAGGVTALVTGELNRPDGLTDIAVAIAAPGGSAQVLVFESPVGALRGQPEAFSLPAAATALAVADLDGDFWNDLAIGAGKELLIVHSRDRKLSLSKTVRSQVAPATVTRQSLTFTVQSLASGGFASPQWLQLAALGDDGKVHLLERTGAREPLAARLSIAGPDGRMHVAAGTAPRNSAAPRHAPAASASLLLTGEIDVPGLASVDGVPPQLVAARVSSGNHDLIVVNTAASKLHIISKDLTSAEPALRLAASLDASGAPAAVLPMRLHPHPLSDLVSLEAGAAGLQVLHPRDVTNFIVTTTADSGTGSLREAINGSTQTQGPSSITFNIPTTDPNYNSATGVFTITPIGVLNGYNNVTNAEPMLGGPAVTLDAYTQPGASPNTLANGDNAVLRIRIDGAQGGVGSVGLQTFSGTTDTIRGFIVTGFNDPLALPTGDETGGTGIEPDGGNDFIEGNFVGTDPTGTTALANNNGVIAFGSGNGNTIGGTTPQARNLISGNNTGTGDAFVSNPNTYFVQGNYIGTDATGTKALLNGQGAGGAGANTVIGGTVAGAANILSGNNRNTYAVSIASNGFGASYLFQGNFIGTDVTGAVAIPNLSIGVEIDSINHTGNQYPTSVDNTVGGTTPGARNIISGNALGGILISDGADSTLVQGNYIGLDVTGTHALGNGAFSASDGIFNGVIASSPNSTPPANTTIGGETPGAGNVISANAGNGIQIVGLGAAVRINVLETFGNTVEGNWIGTDATGANALGNQTNGLYVNTGGGLNLIGDPDGASGNTIGFNGGAGILVDPGTPSGQAGTGNTITANTIFSNTGAGVRMPSGIGSAISRNSIYLNGLLGIDTATSGLNTQSSCSSGSASPTLLQNAPSLVSTSGSTVITATATDPNGNTSEFSSCALVTPVNNLITVTGTLITTEPNAQYTVELFQSQSCDISGFGQGKQYVGNLSLTTNASCTAPISLPIDLSKADLSMTLSPPPIGTQDISSGYLYTMSGIVTNLGAANATNVVYTLVLPSGFTFAAATTSQGVCAPSAGTVTCDIGNLASGTTVKLTVSVTISATTPGNQTATASVTATQTDPNLANNTASLIVGVVIPFPNISGFTPLYLAAGSPDSTVTINGSGFYPASVVTFNNVTLTNVTFVNSTTLNVVVPAALLVNYGAFPVTVSNGSGAFQTSTPLNFWVRVPCTFGLSQPSVAVGAAGATNLSFNVTAPAGCMWEVYNPGFYPVSFTPTSTITDSDGDLIGSGTVTFTVNPNTGAPSIYTIEILPTTPQGCFNTPCGPPLGQESDFIIYQGGAITCTYALSAPSVNVPVGGLVGIGPNSSPTGSGTFYVNVSDPSCIPTVTTSVPWITQQGQGGNTVQWEEDYNVSANTGAARSGNIVVTGLESVTGSTPNLAILNFVVNEAGNANAGPASLTAIGGTPQSTLVSTGFATALQVTVKDGNGNLLSGQTVTFSVPNSGASATLSAPSAVTNASGVASVTATANATAGSYQVTASLAALSATFSLTNTAASPGSLAATGGTSQSTAVNTAFTTPLQVTVKDTLGNLMNGVVVNFTVPTSGAGASLSSLTATTNASGIATVNATANTVVGNYTVLAAVGLLSTSFSLTNTPGAPASITATAGTPQSTVVGTAFTTALQATVKDAFGNVVPGASVTFTPPASGPGGTFTGSATVTTNSFGVAIAPTFAANNTAGSYHVTAASGSPGTTFSLTNNPGPASLMTIAAGNNQSSAIGIAFTTALAVKVTDQFSNPISAVAVTFTPPGSGAGGTFTGSATVNTAATGIATAPTFTANGTTGPYQVTAAAGSLSATFNLTNLTGPPANIVVLTGNPQSATVNTAFATAFTVQITDTLHNPLQGVTVTFTPPASGASGSFSGSSSLLTDASGTVAAPTFSANTTAGSYGVTAAAGALTAIFSLTNNAGPASLITIASGNNQSAAIGGAFTTPLAVRITDQFSNPIGGIAVTFAAPSSGAGGTFAGAATVNTAVNGIATSPTFTSNGTAGAYQVTATAGALSASFSLTNLTGPPSPPYQRPALIAAPSSLQFSVPGCAVTAPSQKLNLNTSDGSSLSYNAQSGATWLTVTPSSGNVSSGTSLIAAVNTAGLAPGPYSTTLVLTAPPASWHRFRYLSTSAAPTCWPSRRRPWRSRLSPAGPRRPFTLQSADPAAVFRLPRSRINRGSQSDRLAPPPPSFR